MPRPSRGQLCQSCDRRWPTTRADRSESAGREPSHYQQYPSRDQYPPDEENTASKSDPPQSVNDNAKQWIKEKEAKKKAKASRRHRSFALPGSAPRPRSGPLPRKDPKPEEEPIGRLLDRMKSLVRSLPPDSKSDEEDKGKPNPKPPTHSAAVQGGPSKPTKSQESQSKCKQPSDEPKNSDQWVNASILASYNAREELSRKGKARRAQAKAKAKLQQKSGIREAANERKAGRSLFITESDSESDVEMEDTGAGTSTALVPNDANTPQNNALTGLDSMSLEGSRSLTSSLNPPDIFGIMSGYVVPDFRPSAWLQQSSNTPDQAEAIAPPPVEPAVSDSDQDEVYWTAPSDFDR